MPCEAARPTSWGCGVVRVRRGPVEGLLHDVWREVSGLHDGEIATYIPELAKADPATCGISLATLDGQVYVAGDLPPFSIQSVSKPFAYALALADRGEPAVLAKVGTEPTGDPFNSISIDVATGRAHNPMVNAGAIVTSALVEGTTREAQFERLLTGLSGFAGRPLDVDEEVFASERDTGDRNRAIAYLMRSAGLLEDDVDEQVELYFRQCSVLVTARDLAVMAATLAHGGLNPVTGEQVVPRHVVASVLTVMTTCGMYDYAGEWLFRVGLPAKSGVSGGISAALPGQLGLGVHSPLLDRRGNSVRGVAACESLSRRLGMHLLLPGEQTRSGLRRSYRADAVRSRRGRPRAHHAILDAEGSAVTVHELVGEEGFASTERLVRLVLEDLTPARWQILDLRRVTRVDTAAMTLLTGLVRCRDTVVTVLVEPRSPAARTQLRELPDQVVRFVELDVALEWCETQLLLPAAVPTSCQRGWSPSAPRTSYRDSRRPPSTRSRPGPRPRCSRRAPSCSTRTSRPTACTSSAPARSARRCAPDTGGGGGGSARSWPAHPSGSSPSSTASRARPGSWLSSPRSATSSRPPPTPSCRSPTRPPGPS
jgi:glutaminase